MILAFHLGIPFTKKPNNVIGYPLIRNGTVFGGQVSPVRCVVYYLIGVNPRQSVVTILPKIAQLLVRRSSKSEGGSNKCRKKQPQGLKLRHPDTSG